jgi:uncharacterized RDD family membrane protein YckC
MGRPGVEAEARTVKEGEVPLAAWILSLPEEIKMFQGDSAGVVSRLLAGAVDVAVVALVLSAGYFALAGLVFLIDPVAFRFPLLPRAAVFGLAPVLAVLHLATSWTGSGRTYGDRLLGLRVVDRHGRDLRLEPARRGRPARRPGLSTVSRYRVAAPRGPRPAGC